ncbi:MAG: hypothetical protein R3C14_43125 [Caldilineaceae bacterium]
MTLQAFLPSFAIELALALGLTVLLIALLWTVRRFVHPNRSPWARWVLVIALQTLLFLCVLGATWAVASVNVAWLVMVLTAAFGAGARLYRQPGSQQAAPAAQPRGLTAVSTLPAVQDVVVEQAEVQPAFPTLPTTTSVTVQSGQENEPSSSEVQTVTNAGEEQLNAAALPVTSAAVVAEDAPADVTVAAETNATAVEMDEESTLSRPRPWQSRVPVGLTPRPALGQATIRALRV